MRLFFSLCLICLTAFYRLCGEEEIYLSNIRQLTFPSMGFEKAGEAYFSPDEKKIIFQAVPRGELNYQMYVMDLETHVTKMVSTGKGACTCGYFHPYDQKIIFSSSHEDPSPEEPIKQTPGKYKWNLTPYMNIYEANIDGSSLKALTSGPSYHAECAYSADGKQIVFASNEEGYMNVYLMESDGTNIRKLTDSVCYNGGPFFSPNGKQIIFRADREKPDYLQIYVIDVDGSNEKQLTFNNAVNWAPYWHPNGEVIAFTTSLHGHHCYEVYLMNIHTKMQTRLTYNPSFDGLPVFNKEGTKLMWTSQRGEDRSCQIFIADFTMPSNGVLNRNE